MTTIRVEIVKGTRDVRISGLKSPIHLMFSAYDVVCRRGGKVEVSDKPTKYATAFPRISRFNPEYDKHFADFRGPAGNTITVCLPRLRPRFGGKIPPVLYVKRVKAVSK
jgi:hypothetical protein